MMHNHMRSKKNNSHTCFLLLLLNVALPAHAKQKVQPPRPLIVAHRGLLRHSPENTLTNFRACLDLQFGFEFDVRRSKDGHLVCIHDATVDRTTNGHGKVSDLTLAQMKKLDAGSWFDPTSRNQRIPTVDEVFRLVAKNNVPSALIAVDLKGEDELIERDVVHLANQHGILDRLLFIGRAITSPQVRHRLRQTDAKAHIARVANNAEEFPAALSDQKADWVYVRYLPSKEEVSQVHKQGKRMFLVESAIAGELKENRRQAVKLGVDAMLTDYPLLVNQLRREEASP